MEYVLCAAILVGVLAILVIVSVAIKLAIIVRTDSRAGTSHEKSGCKEALTQRLAPSKAAWLWWIYEILVLGCVLKITEFGDLRGLYYWELLLVGILCYCLFILPITTARYIAAFIETRRRMEEVEPGPTPDAHDRARPSGWRPLPYGYNATAVAGFSIVGCGLHLCFSGPAALLFPFIAALELGLGWRRFSRFALCLLLAVTLGSAATWAGVGWNHTHCLEHCLDEYGERRWDWVCEGVTGFPLQGIEFHYPIGSEGWLLHGNILLPLLANFALFSAAFFALAFAIPKRALRYLTIAALYPALVAGLLGLSYMFERCGGFD